MQLAKQGCNTLSAATIKILIYLVVTVMPTRVGVKGKRIINVPGGLNT